MGLSPKQQNMLNFIHQFIRDNGYPPSIREIGSALGISSTSVVKYNLDILEREGHIERDRTISRGIKLKELRGDSTIRVPLLGVIAAGEPIPVLSEGTLQAADDYLELTRDIIKDTNGVYALRVKGNSMIDALVHDGDVVIVRQQDSADNGDMVAVWLQDREETTLKRFYHEGERVRLQPANPSMQPIYARPTDVRIQGKVIAVIRALE
jgi:repressor LexA